MRFFRIIPNLLVIFLIPVVIFFLIKEKSPVFSDESVNVKFGIVVHGGAGFSRPGDMDTEEEQLILSIMDQAINAGYQVLENGGSSIDAVEAAIRILEDSPEFNAGKGSVYTFEGYNELDASIMSGDDLNAGAVAAVRDIKNPIAAARKVMESSPHVLLSGVGASEFAANQGLKIVDTSYFFSERSWKSHQKRKQKMDSVKKHGTVGCVALN